MATKTEKDPKAELIHQNMRFYGQVQDTPREAQKSFNNGRFSGTDINPMWRIKRLTEVFGPSGFGWWTQNVKYNFVPSEQTNEVAVFCELELVVVDPETELESRPIYGVGGNTFVAQRRSGPQASDEAMKMAYTDALSIACKALGFSHDIYYQNDRTKYSMASDAQPAAKPAPAKTAEAAPATEEAPAVDNLLPLNDVMNELNIKLGAMTKVMTDEQKQELAAKIKDRIGIVNYKKCTDVVKLNALLNDIKAA